MVNRLPPDSSGSEPVRGQGLALRYTVIGACVVLPALAFAYVGGWLDSGRLSPNKIIRPCRTFWPPRGLSPQPCEGCLRRGLLRQQWHGARSSRPRKCSPRPHAGRRPPGDSRRQSLRARQQRADPQHGLALHAGQRPAMAHGHERHAGVPGCDAAGVLRADPREPSRPDDTQAGPGAREGILREPPPRPRRS